jgi:hypothetical protein
MNCLNPQCEAPLMEHEGLSDNSYYYGYCDECCEDRKRESDEEAAERWAMFLKWPEKEQLI